VNFARRQRSRDLVVPQDEADLGSSLARSANVIRSLASDLVEERRRSKRLEREIEQLQAELAAERRRSS
jgi:hypothetical protein